MIAHDVVIVGSGVAGMRCAVELRRAAPQADIAVVTKLYPTRADSGAAQGGIAAPLGNVRYDDTRMPVPTAEGHPADDWLAHMDDTARGADFIGDQDAQELMCREAAPAIYELEHMGVPFSRLPDGRIAQRSFGGHTNPRACYAVDRTGHAILHTLYGELVRHNVRVYPEAYMLGVVIEDNICSGITAIDIRTGDIDVINARATMFATGGYGRAFKITSNSYAATGDGITAAYRAGIPLEDMEFVQFHPTGLLSRGILLSEGTRGEGGYLLNGDNERFMARYAPDWMELAPRDVVSRAIYTEIEAGRGAGPNGECVLLDLRHLGGKKLAERLPRVVELARDYLGVDPVVEPVPIQPAAHAAMGGIPTDVDGRVIRGEHEVVAGLYAAGECACVSVHGANRLGANGLLEATIYGRRTGRTIADFIDGDRPDMPTMPSYALREAEDEIAELMSRDGREIAADIRDELQTTMFANAGVFRTTERLTQQLGILQDLRERFTRISMHDKSRRYNTELVEMLELAHLLEFSECIVAGALAREESRGVHARRDFPMRDDANWMRHTLAYRQPDGRPRLDYKPVRYGPDGPRFKPEERKY